MHRHLQKDGDAVLAGAADALMAKMDADGDKKVRSTHVVCSIGACTWRA
jgi:hypothetical protein